MPLLLLRSIESTTRRIGGGLAREIALGPHIHSAVNVAEYSPRVCDAVTEYLERYVDLVPGLRRERERDARGLVRVEKARAAAVNVG